MTTDKFDELVHILTPTIDYECCRYRDPISVTEQLVICLRFLSTGDSFTTIASSYRRGVSTVAKVVYRVCDALWETLNQLLLPKPTHEKWLEIADRFANRWNFPNCIGAIDGKHVVIEAPPNSGSLYHNYKKSFSIVLLAIVDANYLFTAIDIGAYGSQSDGGILNKRPLGIALETKTCNIPNPAPLTNKLELGNLPYVIVGDEAFPLKDYMMRPYPGKNLPEEKRIFNYRLSRARRISENAFGILVQRWRVYHRRINLFPENVTKVVKGTVILHNFLQREMASTAANSDDIGMPILPMVTSEEPIESQALQDIDVAYKGNRPKAHAMDVREKFKEYFNSPEGAIAFQYRFVNVKK
jgi:hypothetical protein